MLKAINTEVQTVEPGRAVAFSYAPILMGKDAFMGYNGTHFVLRKCGVYIITMTGTLSNPGAPGEDVQMILTARLNGRDIPAATVEEDVNGVRERIVSMSTAVKIGRQCNCNSCSKCKYYSEEENIISIHNAGDDPLSLRNVTLLIERAE